MFINSTDPFTAGDNPAREIAGKPPVGDELNSRQLFVQTESSDPITGYPVLFPFFENHSPVQNKLPGKSREFPRDDSENFPGTFHKNQKRNAKKPTGDTIRESWNPSTDFLNFLPDATFAIDLDGRVIAWNKAIEKMTGVAAADMIGKGDLEYSVPFYGIRVPILIDLILKPNEEAEKKYNRSITRDGDALYAETDLLQFNGRTWILWAKASPLFDPSGTIIGAIETIRDVTHRREAEKKIADYSRLLSTLMDTLPIPVFYKDLDRKYLGCNTLFEEYTGIPRNELVGKTVFDIAPEDLAEQYKTADQEVFDNPVFQKYETKVRFADGSHHDVIFFKAPFFNIDGSVGGLIGGFLDISDRKQAEETIRRSEETYRTLIEHSTDLIYTLDLDGTFTSVNSAVTSLFGFTLEEVIDHSILEFLPLESINRVKQSLDEHAAGDSGASVSEIKFITRDGTVRNVELKSRLRTFADGRKDILGIARDITGRIRADDALRESREILEAILNAIPVRVFWKDKNSVFLGCNTPFARDAGFEKPEDIIGKDDYAMAWKEQAGLYRADDRDVIGSGTARLMFEEPQTTPSGEMIHLLTSKIPLHDGSGEIIGVLGTYFDITDRKRAEDALHQSERRLSDIINFLPDATFAINLDGKVIAWNRAIEMMTGVSADTMLGKGQYEYGIPFYGERRPILIDLVIKKEEETEKKYSGIQRKDDKIIAETYIPAFCGGRGSYLWGIASPLYDTRGNIVGAIESVRDITDRKQAEEAVQKAHDELEERVKQRTAELNEALGEKEILLSEVHHRVKNNLAAFISLLSLEGTYEETPQGRALKTDLQNRARSMSLIHETLYRTRKYAGVDMGLYLDTLTEQIAASYASSRPIRTVVDAENIILDLARATPCGLITNELVTNAFKYAFPEPPPGSPEPQTDCVIRVSMKTDGEKYILTVSDNGIGLPPGFDPSTAKSLGLKLVTFLARHQLRATVRIKRVSGTCFSFRFSRDTTPSRK